MPTYVIEGKRVRTEAPLSDDEIDEIGASIRGAAAPAPTVAVAPPAAPAPSTTEQAVQFAKDWLGGTLRGATGIGATLLGDTGTAAQVRPGSAYSLLQMALPTGTRESRLRETENFLRSQGVDPDSIPYAATKLGTEVAGTAGVGPGLAAPVARTFPSVAQILRTGGLEGGKSFPNLLARVAGGATVGGASSALVSPEDVGVGAGVGAALPFAYTGLRGIGQGLATALSPKSSALLEATEGREQEIINALRGQTQLVPGSMPTAGEAAAPVGATRFSALQKSAEEVLPSEYFARGQQQAAARQAQVQTVGRSEAELAAAKTARSAEASQLYEEAKRGTVKADKTFDTLLSRPSMSRALQRAAQLASERGEQFAVAQAKPSEFISYDPIFNIEKRTPEVIAEYPVSSLHTLKIAMDDLVKDPAAYGISRAEVAAINETRKEYVKWLASKSAKYDEARAAFAKASGPINQMEIGQYLEQKLTAPLSDTTTQRAGVYAQALRDAPSTIRRATEGVPRFEQLKDVLTPDQVKAVESVRADLARGKLFEDQARAARAAGPEALGAAQEAFRAAQGGADMPSLLSRPAAIANAILKRVAGKMDRKLAIELATEMLSPEETALAIEKAMAQKAGRAAFDRAAQEAMRGLPVGVVNALTAGQGQERRNALAP